MYFGSANRLMPVPLDASWSFLSNQICNRNGHISEIKTKKTPWWVSAKTFMVHFHWFTFSIILSMFIKILKMIKVTKQQMVVFETTKSQSRSVFFQLPTSDNYGVVRHASSPWPFSWRPAPCCAVTLGETVGALGAWGICIRWVSEISRHFKDFQFQQSKSANEVGRCSRCLSLC